MASRRRKWIRVLAWVAGIVAAIVLALPLWFPWVFRSLAAHFGAHYGRYERVGYGRFRLSDCVLTNSAGRFTAKRVDLWVPTVWLSNRVTGSDTAPFLAIENWQWESIPSASPRPATPPAEVYAAARRTAATIRRWMPRAEARTGVIRIDRQTIEIPEAIWTKGDFQGTARWAPRPELVAIHAILESDTVLNVSADSDALGLSSRFNAREDIAGLAIEGNVEWLTNRIEISTRFSRNGLLPDSAVLRADAFRIPPNVHRLREFSDITGSVSADWRTNRFDVRLTATTYPNATNPAPITLEARATGDTNRASIEEARITSSWLVATLSTNVVVQYRAPFVPEPARLNLSADLARQSWAPVRGTLAGGATIHPSGGQYPEIQFAASGSNFAAGDVRVASIRLGGRFNWPRLELAEVEARTPDGSEFTFAGALDVSREEVSGGRLNFRGGFGQQFLPAGYRYKSASLNSSIAGPVRAPVISAALTVDELFVPRSQPIHVEARWNGVGLVVSNAEVQLAAGASEFRMRGSADWSRREKEVQLTSADLSRSNHLELSLNQPFRVRLFSEQRAGSASRDLGEFDLEPAFWSGDGRELQVAGSGAWPSQATVRCEARGISSDLVQDFIHARLPEARIDTLDVSGGWTNGPAAFRMESTARGSTSEGIPFFGRLKASGGPAGISLDELSVSTATQAVGRVQGTLPVVFNPSATPRLVEVSPDSQLRVKCFTDPNSLLWTKIAQATGFVLEHPVLSVDIEGRWGAPTGRASVKIQRVAFPQMLHPLPPLAGLDAAFELDKNEARIPRCTATIDGRPVSLTARVPLGEKFWSLRRRDWHWPSWEDASARIRMDQVSLSALARYVPSTFSPEGALDVDLSVNPGYQIDGQISVANVRTRPLIDIGPIREIKGTLRFAGGSAVLTNFSGNIGGQTVQATGWVQVRRRFWLERSVPVFQFRLTGTNVPLVRRPGVLLRADWDLMATNSGAAPTVISGSVRLRNSLYLADLQDLVPSRVATAERRPPYFSVAAEPWASWRLNVDLKGSDAMRVQTPVFSGKVSLGFTLGGTLKDPIALGEARINSGTVTFPFGSLEVKQGLVSLTSADPFRPQLYVTATATRFGYDVRMEVTGPADAPVIQFSSIPPLGSEQILTMLTTGQIPLSVGMTSSTQQRAEGFAVFLGKNVLSGLGVGGGGQDRLTIRSGEQISESGRPTYEATYRLNENWSLVGEYDRFDQYNLNLKWRVYSR